LLSAKPLNVKKQPLAPGLGEPPSVAVKNLNRLIQVDYLVPEIVE
jgi:hypothetical protein